MLEARSHASGDCGHKKMLFTPRHAALFAISGLVPPCMQQGRMWTFAQSRGSLLHQMQCTEGQRRGVRLGRVYGSP